MKLSSAQAMRDAEGKAIHVLGIPSTLLMTNAAKALAKTVAEFLGPQKKVVIFSGPGGCGGDGFCTAALLLRHGVNVRCFLVGDRIKMTSDSIEMERRLIELGGFIETFEPMSARQRSLALDAEVIIDAIFGIGLRSAIKGMAKAAVELINESKATVISADIASGVQADTGAILGCAVRADLTVTFSMAKPGHFVEPGGVFCGKLCIADIGIPSELLDKSKTNFFAVMADDIFLPKREPVSHKGDYGRLLVIGGSVGLSGAPVLCANAALRSGAGLVFLGVPEAIYPLTAPRLLEAMCRPLPDDGSGRLSLDAESIILSKLQNSSACVIGCGLSRSEGLDRLMRRVLASSETQLVVDADGLFALGDDPRTIRSAKLPPVLTPHEGEFARLGGVLSGNRMADALSFAKSRNCILALKGHRVICAFPDGDVYITAAGNPGMAKGGSGDVLAGIIGALICQLPLKRAVVTACMIHALSGNLAAGRFGEYSMLPGDIIDAIPETMKSITRQT